jgi:hypothetical protein
MVSPPASKPTTASDLLGDDFFGGDAAPSQANGNGNGFGADPFDDFNPRGSAAPPQQQRQQQQHADPFFSRTSLPQSFQ